MAVRSGAQPALPNSHFFFTVAWGRSARTFALRRVPVLTGLGILPIALLWLVGSTLYLMFHDDLVASLMLRERDMQYGYEDRIATLQSQIDRAASKEMMTQRSIAARLDELTARETELQSRSGILGRLEQQFSEVLSPKNAAPVAHAATSFAADPGPHAQLGPESEAPAPASDAIGKLPERLSKLSTDLDAVTTAQDSEVQSLSGKVQAVMGRYREALNATGLDLGRLTAAGKDEGGPFVPLAKVDDGSPFARSTVSLQLNLSEAARVARAMARVPLRKPLRGDPEVTSPFGARIDPFFGRPAMHTGIDLAEDAGTDVYPTAPGKVTFAGEASGYGLMVEVDHGSGLTTRYAHMSEIITAVGAQVRPGEVIGHVGSTGRATGPHLHYETRIDGEPVDPARFLAAGRRLFVDAS
jgi:murein DD-endopeptidase MepM/ murein hydrolase activator NlpD